MKFRKLPTKHFETLQSFQLIYRYFVIIKLSPINLWNSFTKSLHNNYDKINIILLKFFIQNHIKAIPTWNGYVFKICKVKLILKYIIQRLEFFDENTFETSG